MIKRHMTFVVGAGASCELDLPDGKTLKGRIAANLCIDEARAERWSNQWIARAIQTDGHKTGDALNYQALQSYVATTRQLVAGLALSPSIDTYLDTHRNDRKLATVGKIGIAYTILHEESKSALMGITNHKHFYLPVSNPNLQNSWLIRLTDLIFANQTVEDVRRIFEKITFIVFNYDRCLEHYLYLAIQQYFNVNGEVAAECMKGLTIIHPYGQVGHLAWQAGNHKAQFGQHEHHELWEVAQELRTFTESVDEGIAAAAKEAILIAENVVFLGFGFVAQNVELLTGRGMGAAKRVFATAYQASAQNIGVMKNDISAMIHKPERAYNPTGANDYEFIFEPGRCSALMDNNRLVFDRG